MTSFLTWCALLLQERLFLVSDKYQVHVCEWCGMIAVAQRAHRNIECRACRNTTQVCFCMRASMTIALLDLASVHAVRVQAAVSRAGLHGDLTAHRHAVSARVNCQLV